MFDFLNVMNLEVNKPCNHLQNHQGLTWILANNRLQLEQSKVFRYDVLIFGEIKTFKPFENERTLQGTKLWVGLYFSA